MSKAPAFQFYPGDWRRDTQVQMLSMFARGVWFEMLCCMWDAPERGKLVGSYPQIGRLLGCTEQELRDAIVEINVTKTGDVTECNDLVTIINRRMYREESARKSTRLRVQKHRETIKAATSNTDITVPSSSSSSSSCTKVHKEGRRNSAATPAKTKYLDSVFLSDDERRKLQEAMGQKSLEVGIEKLDYSITVKGGKYKDHYKTLLNWYRRGYLAGNNGNSNVAPIREGPVYEEYRGDDIPDEILNMSDEQRVENIQRVRELLGQSCPG